MSKARHPLFRIWTHLRQVKYNPGCPDHEQWSHLPVKGIDDFEEFRDWVEQSIGPRPWGYRFNRLKKTRGWVPGNVTWSLQPEVAACSNFVLNYTYKGKKQCLSAWAAEYKINPHTLRNRLKRNWPLKQALTEPIQKKFRHHA